MDGEDGNAQGIPPSFTLLPPGPGGTPPPDNLIGPGQPPNAIMPADVLHDADHAAPLEGFNGGMVADAFLEEFGLDIPPPAPQVLIHYNPLRHLLAYEDQTVEAQSTHSSAFLMTEEYNTWPLLHLRMPGYHTIAVVSFAVLLTSVTTPQVFWHVTAPNDEYSDLYARARIAMSTVADTRDANGLYVFPREVHYFGTVTGVMLRLVAEYFSRFRASMIRCIFDLAVAPILPPNDPTAPRFGPDLFRLYYVWEGHPEGPVLPPVRDVADRRRRARLLLHNNNFLHSALGVVDYLNSIVITFIRINFWMNSRANPPDHQEILGMYRRMRLLAERSGFPLGTRVLVDWIPPHLYFVTVVIMRQALSAIADGSTTFTTPTAEAYRDRQMIIEQECEATMHILHQALFYIAAM
ncbi:hypothetical protein BV25DRAFT_1840894 [Artomyces pyxidatus]|uniref:Uncharacterized protein n=1 Tax=Artomyces pyxidatus TaxID=48021 RepID=A0ACB8SQY4_9AGAM|nr:hypothetical protein BV25DRAFT_1840894 [Artomyces pyxidatus]